MIGQIRVQRNVCNLFVYTMRRTGVTGLIGVIGVSGQIRVQRNVCAICVRNGASE